MIRIITLALTANLRGIIVMLSVGSTFPIFITILASFEVWPFYLSKTYKSGSKGWQGFQTVKYSMKNGQFLLPDTETSISHWVSHYLDVVVTYS